MKTKTTFLTTVLFLAVSLSLTASPVQKGAASLGLGGSYSELGDFDLTLVSMDYSYFLIDNVGLRLGVDYANFGIEAGPDSLDVSTWIGGAGLDYYFTNPQGNWATYVGASFLYADSELSSNLINTDLSADETGYELRVGFHYFFSESVSMDTRFTYLDLGGIDSQGLSLGLALWF